MSFSLMGSGPLEGGETADFTVRLLQVQLSPLALEARGLGINPFKSDSDALRSSLKGEKSHAC